MPLWNIVLSGYPASGKTVLARRLVVEQPNFLRLSVDDMRDMFFGSKEPSSEEEFIYTGFASLRDLALRMGHNVVLDCTAPRPLPRGKCTGGATRHWVILPALASPHA